MNNSAFGLMNIDGILKKWIGKSRIWFEVCNKYYVLSTKHKYNFYLLSFKVEWKQPL